MNRFLPTRRKIESTEPEEESQTSSAPAVSVVASSASSGTQGRLINQIHLIAHGTGQNAHIPKLWSGYAYTDRFEYAHGSKGTKLKQGVKFAHECTNNSPKDHLDKLVQEKMRKGYTFNN